VIDSHCHLTDPRLRQQLDAVLARATDAGVDRAITIGTDIADARAAIDLCHAHASLRCAIGIHPNYCHEADISHIDTLRELQSDPAVVALGEMGLDYFHKFADRATQVKFFEAQLALAQELTRPVVIHSRDSIDDSLSILKNFPTVPAVFHCFTGTSGEARRIVDAGYLLGFTGAVTFNKNDDLRQAARLTPGDRLLVETDAPYLTPEPLRKQKTNEPSFVVHVAATIARVWEMSVEEVDRITTQNVEQFFDWKEL